jgi:hypothetical protein
MRWFLLTVLTVLVLCATTQAFALDAPKLTRPPEGIALGPSYDVMGTLPAKALVVVMTDVIDADGNVFDTVPGIRHYTYDDGSFLFRCASPRAASKDSGAVFTYRVRVFAMQGEEKGPETVVNCGMKRK